MARTLQPQSNQWKYTIDSSLSKEDDQYVVQINKQTRRSSQSLSLHPDQ